MKPCLIASVFFLALMAAPIHAAAEDLEIDPMSWDYGETVVGTPSTHSITLSSLGPSPVWVYVVQLTPEPTDELTCGVDVSCDFKITSISDPIPREMAVGESLSVEVAFTPSALGPRQAYLYVASNDSVGDPGTQAFVPLTGAGIQAPAWGAAGNAEASTGTGTGDGIGKIANGLSLFLLPVALVAGWKGMRRWSASSRS
jgi:hypothetical protein